MSQMAGEDQQTYTTVYDVQVQGQQGMNALLDITNQYAAASDTLLGKVAKLNTGFVGMAKHFTGLKPLNAGAVSEAARYQQMLSGLEATVKVSTKGNKEYHDSFNQLRADTKQLAREMPIGMGQAIQQVDALQQSGVKSNREIKSLARTYTELGKATGEFGPQLGADMQALNRQYDANTKQARGYADSLTTVTAKLGGTASGTLSFAKSIAPIAATVGVGESQVLGMSNAFSKMGEDGYGAATAVNKVLLDLNRSVRQGTPEMSSYARLLDMSTGSLAKLFKQDPAEVITRFTEAIKKQGPEAITTLDQLGFDGVRQSRAIAAAAQGGGLRQSIQTAVAAYGNNATKRGADTATGGLNDQLVKLQETTRQTVEATGRPFLSYLTEIVKLTNSASQGIRSMVDSNAAQKVGQVGAAVGTVGGGLLRVASLGLTAAFAKNILTGGARAFLSARADFRTGRQAMVNTGDATLARESALNSPMMAQAGARYGSFVGTAGADVEQASMRARALSVLRAGGQAGRAGMIGALGASTALIRSGEYDVTQARTGVRPTSEARSAFNAQMKAAKDIEDASARRAAQLAAMRQMGASTFAADSTVTRAGMRFGAQGMSTLGGGLRYGAGAAAAGVREGGLALGRGLGGLGAGALSMVSPAALGIGAIGGLGYALYQGHQQTQNMAAEAKTAVADPYQAYNEFAGAVGKAGRSASGFADAAEQAANRLANLNPNKGDAYNFTQAEGRAAMAYSGPHALQLSDKEQGKTSIWGRIGHIADAMGTPSNYGKDWGAVFAHGGGNKAASVSELTAKLSTTLGNQASQDDVARMLFDLRSQGVSQTDVHQVGRNLQKIYGPDGSGHPGYKLGVSAAIASQRRSNTLQGASQDTTDYIKATLSGVGQESDRIGSIYGDKSAQAATYGEMDKFLSTYSHQRKGVDKQRRGKIDSVVASTVAEALGLSEDDVKKHMDAGSVSELMNDVAKSGSKQTRNGVKGYRSLNLGSTTDMADILRLGRQPEEIGRERKAGQALDTTFEEVTGFKAHAKAWDKGLHGVEDQLFSMGKTLETGGKALEAGMTPLQKALYVLKTEGPDARRTFLAGQQLAGAQMQRYGGNASMANLGLASSLGQTQDPVIQDAIKSAQAYVSTVIAPIKQAQMSPVGALKQRVQAGVVAQQQLPNANTAEEQQALTSQIQDAAAAQAQMIGMRRQYEQQVIDTFRQIGIANKQELVSEQRANEDYQRSRLYAEQDFSRQVSRSKADFHRNQAHEEFTFQRSVTRATEDYNKTRARSEEDYERTRTRAMEDFQRTELYAIQDHQRQVSYLLKDAASNMYDPYKRIQAADVMDSSGLASNISEQAAMLRKQSANVKRLLELGLSQRTVDSLDMYNPENAYQVERLVQDIENDRSQAQTLNLAVGEKDAAAGEMATSNESYRRAQDEFATSQTRMQDANKVAMDRMAQDQQISLTRMATDENTAMARMMQDMVTQRKWEAKEFTLSLGRAEADQALALGRMAIAHHVALARSRADLATSQGIMLAQLSQTGIQLTQSASAVSNAAAAAIAQAPLHWIGPLNQAINSMGRVLRAGIAANLPSALTVGYTLTPNAGNTTTPAGSTVPGWMLAKTNAKGGIATQPFFGVMAEAGVPEALIPLDQRGAGMLHEVLRRYATDEQTRGVNAQTYAQGPQAPQVFSYDYSTKIDSVTVQANDPHEMFRELENISSTKRLIQPAGN